MRRSEGLTQCIVGLNIQKREEESNTLPHTTTITPFTDTLKRNACVCARVHMYVCVCVVNTGTGEWTISEKNNEKKYIKEEARLLPVCATAKTSLRKR